MDTRQLPAGSATDQSAFRAGSRRLWIRCKRLLMEFRFHVAIHPPDSTLGKRRGIIPRPSLVSNKC
jgi:hypothetical protein